jgi:hypothetical protein
MDVFDELDFDSRIDYILKLRFVAFDPQYYFALKYLVI